MPSEDAAARANVIMCSVTIIDCLKAAQWPLEVGPFKVRPPSAFQTNVIMCNAITSASPRGRQCRRTTGVSGGCSRKCAGKMNADNAAISAYVRSRQCPRAVGLLEETRSHVHEVKVITSNAIKRPRG